MQIRFGLALMLGALAVPIGSATELSIDYSFEAPTSTEVVIEGVPYRRLFMAGAPCGGNPGEPRLPGRGASILIPHGEAVTGIEVTGEASLVGSGYLIEPAGLPFPISRGPTEENIPRPDEVIYGSSAPFPAARHVSLGTQGFRGYDILFLRLQPMKYIPTTGELYYYPSLRVSVQTEPAAGRNALLRGLTETASISP
jgi:hypothetical protein